MGSAVVGIKAIDDIIKKVRTILFEGQGNFKNAKEQEKIKSYWNRGYVLSNSYKEVDTESIYGVKGYEKLSDSLKISKKLPYFMMNFSKTYDINKPGGNKITWIHYKYLLSVHDENQRKAIEKRIINENLCTIYKAMPEQVKFKQDTIIFVESDDWYLADVYYNRRKQSNLENEPMIFQNQELIDRKIGFFLPLNYHCYKKLSEISNSLRA